jgi:hypothetical protein
MQRVKAVLSAPGVLAAMRGHLEVRDQDEFVDWILAGVTVDPGARFTEPAAGRTDTTAITDDLVDAVAERVALKLQGSYAPPGLQTYAPPAPALTYATQPPPAAPAPAPAGTLDLARLTPLQRALVNAMLPQGR